MSSPLSAALRFLLLLCSLVMTCPVLTGFSQSLTRNGAEFSVLGPRSGDQSWPQMALGANGGYIVWQDNAIDGQASGIAAQRVSGTFNAVSNIFRVNYTTAGVQERPDVALLSNGGAVVVWQSGAPGFQQINARFIKPDGAFLARDIVLGERTSSSTKKWQANRWIWVQNKLRRQRLQLQRTVRRVREADQAARVVALPDGGAVVVYSGIRKTITNATDWIPHVTWRGGRYFTNSIRENVTTRFDNMHDILLQRLSASGAKVGSEVTVNQFTDFNQRTPSITLLPDGNLLIVWVSEQEFARPLSASLESILSVPGIADSPTIGRILGENRVVISARIVTQDGAGVTDEFRVDGDGSTVCANPEAKVVGDNAVTIAWSCRDTVRTNGWEVYARAFSITPGLLPTPLTQAVRVNTFQLGDQVGPKLTTVGPNQGVVWTSNGQDGSHEGVYGRLLTNGTPASNELRVNTTMRFSQRHPAVATLNGEVVAIWSSFTGVASGVDLLGQRFTSSGGLAGNTTSSGAAGASNTSGSDGALGSGNQTSTSATQGNVASGIRVTLEGTGSKLTLGWNTASGGVYQVQSSTNLITWTDVGSERSGTGSPDSMRFGSGTPGATFYRVKRVR